MRHAVIAAAAAASLTVGGLLLHAAWGRGPKTDATSSRGTDSSETIDAMGKELASLKGTVARLQGRPALPRSVDPRGGSTEEAPSTEPLVKGTTPPPPPPDARAFIDAFDTQVVAEAVDPTWSREAEANATNALEGEAMRGSKLLRIDCRSTLCRMDVAHEADEALARFMEVLPKTAPFHYGGVAYALQEEEGGHPRTVVFVAREGYALPRIQAAEALSARE